MPASLDAPGTARSALLLVPSLVTAGEDIGAVINPEHPDAGRIVVEPEIPLALDRRLFCPVR